MTAETTNSLRYTSEVPNSVKSLRRYYRNRTNLPSSEHVRGQLIDESDRSIVTLMASLLDDALVYRIAGCAVLDIDQKHVDHIFRYEGPLGTFASRIEIAYLFGFISTRMRGQLETLREMRNACAHANSSISFTTKELATVAKRIFYPTGIFRLSDYSPPSIKDAFVDETISLYALLLEGNRVSHFDTHRNDGDRSSVELS